MLIILLITICIFHHWQPSSCHGLTYILWFTTRAVKLNSLHPCSFIICLRFQIFARVLARRQAGSIFLPKIRNQMPLLGSWYDHCNRERLKRLRWPLLSHWNLKYHYVALETGGRWNVHWKSWNNWKRLKKLSSEVCEFPNGTCDDLNAHRKYSKTNKMEFISKATFWTLWATIKSVYTICKSAHPILNWLKTYSANSDIRYSSYLLILIELLKCV